MNKPLYYRCQFLNWSKSMIIRIVSNYLKSTMKLDERVIINVKNNINRQFGEIRKVIKNYLQSLLF